MKKIKLLALILAGLLAMNTVVYAEQPDSAVLDTDSGQLTAEEESAGDDTDQMESSAADAGIDQPAADEETEDTDLPQEDSSDETEDVPAGETDTEEEPVAEKQLVDVCVETVKGVEQIPAKFIDQLDGVNLLKITTKYSDGTEGFVSLLKSADNMGTKIAFEYEDINEYEALPELPVEETEESDSEEVLKSIRRHYVIRFFEEVPEESDETADPVMTAEYDVEFFVTPMEEIDVKNNLTFQVTEAKNWRLFRMEPQESQEYGFTTSKSANISLIMDDGEYFEKYDISDTFVLDSEKTYTVLMVYDMSGFYENMK